jgi:hypothetical protein
MPVRVTQENMEVLGVGTPDVLVTQDVVGVLGGATGTNNVRVTQGLTSVLGGATGTNNVRVTQGLTSVLGGATSHARTTQVIIQVLGSLNPPPYNFSTTPFIPAFGPPGTCVYIFGTTFTGATSVKFNGVDATSYELISDSLIVAVVPSTTSGPITVKGISTLANFVVTGSPAAFLGPYN